MADLTHHFGGQPLRLAEPPVLFSPEKQFADAIERAGMIPPSSIVLDGKVHRFSPEDKKGDDAGWYIGFDDNVPAGVFGSWRIDKTHRWRADIGRPLSQEEEMVHQQNMKRATAARDSVLEQKRVEAAKKVFAIWNSTEEAPADHPYLMAKGVQPHGIHVTGDGRLVLPLYDMEKLTSLQYIDAEGGKRYHPGGVAKGSFNVLGDIPALKIFITEGFATAATVHEVSGRPVVIAYSAGNLEPVTGTIRQNFPSSQVVIVADNDKLASNGHRAGQEAAIKAAELHGVNWVMPPEEGTDANDFVRNGGDLLTLLEGVSPPRNKFSEKMIRSGDLHPMFLSTLNQTWVIKGVLPSSSGLNVIYGKPGTYKSFLALDMVASIAAGIPWHGHDVKRRSVLYLAAEGQQGILKRLEAWKIHRKIHEFDNFSVLPLACILDDPKELMAFLTALKREEEMPEIIVIDTLARSMSGDENNASDMGKIVIATDAIAQMTGAQIIVVHHTGKDESRGPRGSISLEGATDTMFKTELVQKSHIVSLVCERQKDNEKMETMNFIMNIVDTGHIDVEGNEVTSLVPELTKIKLKSANNKGGEEKKKEASLKGANLIGLKAFREALSECGEEPQKEVSEARAKDQLALEGKVLHIDRWRESADL
ncbi:MAG: AAA family ATPase, partial [Syntrophorhabdus sp.]